MSAFKLAISVSLFLAGSSSAALLGTRSSGAHALVARATQIPAACNSACTPYFNVVDACPDDECICEKADTRDLSACMSCFLAVDPSESSVVQDYINTFETTCSGLGIPVSSISLSGAQSATASGPASGTTSRVTLTSSGAGAPTHTPSATFLTSTDDATSLSPTDTDSGTDSSTDIFPSTASDELPSITPTTRAVSTAAPTTRVATTAPATTSQAGSGSGSGSGPQLNGGSNLHMDGAGARIALLAGAVGAVFF